VKAFIVARAITEKYLFIFQQVLYPFCRSLFFIGLFYHEAHFFTPGISNRVRLSFITIQVEASGDKGAKPGQ
jgi:hypothetical protein